MGFDPGSSSWKIAVVDDDGLEAEEEIVTKEICGNPGLLRGIIANHADGLEAIAAPSGFGLPVTSIERVGEREIQLMTLRTSQESLVGLGASVGILKGVSKDMGANCYVLPSVKHLSTVPRYRKISRIDLGTSDKLCSAAAGLQCVHERRSLEYGEISFVLAEVGSSFASFICVKGGKIVDGIGGTGVTFGTSASGAIDAELVHVWEFPDKASIYSGGLADAAGMSLQEIETLDPKSADERVSDAMIRFREAFMSDLLAISRRNQVFDFMLSSSLGANLRSDLCEVATDLGLRDITDPWGHISGSIGAAYLANGLIGGGYRGLVESLEILSASGSVMDLLYFEGRPRIQ